MELTLLLTTFAMFCKFPAPVLAQVQCYKCDPIVLSSGFKTNLCQNFRAEEQFTATCQKSSMCYKKTVSMDIGGVKTIGITRGCAPQTLRDDQLLRNGTWHRTHRIHEVYEEKCFEDPNDFQITTKTTHCYCRGDLCNGASVVAETFVVLSILSLVIQLLNGFS